MTHDSIGLGEDGPTHQPVEHLAACRAIPNLLVLRPADAVETAECWEIALKNDTGPSMLVLSRQNLPTVRTTHVKENLSAKGAYVLSSGKGQEKVAILATGSEISVALEAKEKLAAGGVDVRVISMPSWELFERQPESYRKEVLGSAPVRCAVEAAGSFGWERYLGERGIFIGMKGFGESAPAEELYKHFGITAENVVARVKEKLAK
jgi:transketolase